MSYILDALRRAEADRERERGQVPGLNAQPPSSGEPAPAAGPRRWLPWAGGGLLLLAGIGAGSWWASGPNDAPPPVPPTLPTPAPAPARSPAPDVAVAPPAVPQPAASASPYLAPPVPAPVEVAAVPAPAARNTADPVPAPAATPAPAPVPTLPAPAPSPVAVPAAEAPIPRLAELPETTRRELPRLVISGSVYSDDPGSRFVIINGEVQREGARLGNELVLEQIRQHELVLRFKGQRYRQPV